ncbi:hypothetical protein H632_c391p1 [Helicosporidium sp. ATCC 50920]|nr:hypothetical protein H632_c391p1 [Helicosporidium sp. ATCC 50920]|eukprot:KDD76024.1 hypothetical protein H632_c391p1 [Helicosporidium sp. ATCC 50920]
MNARAIATLFVCLALLGPACAQLLVDFKDANNLWSYSARGDAAVDFKNNEIGVAFAHAGQVTNPLNTLGKKDAGVGKVSVKASADATPAGGLVLNTLARANGDLTMTGTNAQKIG